jgi:hypothetical protein
MEAKSFFLTGVFGGLYPATLLQFLRTGEFIDLLRQTSLHHYSIRYLENNIGNIWSKAMTQKASNQPYIIVGSNFGELLGAITVLFTAKAIPQ